MQDKRRWTYELSVKLISTPSDGIGPTRKLFETLLQKVNKIVIIIRFETTISTTELIESLFWKTNFTLRKKGYSQSNEFI